MNIVNKDYLSDYDGVFDVIVMNPPYNDGSTNRGYGHVLWNKFVIKTISQLVEGGYLCAVHPDGWRGLGSGFINVRELIKSKQMLYLEVHNEKDGIKTFGAETTYDFYCLHNTPSAMTTKIKCMDGTTQRVDISKMSFIPNGMYKEFEKILAKDGEERVNVLYSRSAYGYDKKHMNQEQTDEFKYPCVYTVPKFNKPRIMYSNTTNNGHFWLPKVIWSNGRSTTPIIDENGELGLINFAYAIIDEQKNLTFIQKAMQHQDFIKLMAFSDGNMGHKYKYKVIRLFRKDFWKEFK
jgi:hypothetical protein